MTGASDKRSPARFRRCGASLPHEDANDGWYRCIRPTGHVGLHHEGDPSIGWADGEIVEVYTISEVRAVPDHRHEFVGDEDKCVGYPTCQLTWGEHRIEKPFVLEELEDAPAEDACLDGEGNEYPEHDWEDTPTCRRCDAEPEEAIDGEH